MSSGADSVARAPAADGQAEVVLRRRDGVLELIVGGVFAMDSAHTATEQALAGSTLHLLHAGSRSRPDHVEAPDLRILVGGLGLGYTAAALLADPAVVELTVVELEPAVVEWAGRGLLPVAAEVVSDPRVWVATADILDVVPACPSGSLDAIVLDVDNGPQFLVHQGNARVYGESFLSRCAAALRPGGVLAIWSADPSPLLPRELTRVVGPTTEELLVVERDGRSFDYAIYLAQRALGPLARLPAPLEAFAPKK